MAEITQNDRLEAVISKLESVENELRQCKRILQYYRLQEEGGGRHTPVQQRDSGQCDVRESDETAIPETVVEVSDGLYPGQLPYQHGEAPSEIAKAAEIIKEEETGTCAT